VVRAAKQMVAAMVAVAAAEGSERAAMAMDSKRAEACAAVTRAECR